VTQYRLTDVPCGSREGGEFAHLGLTMDPVLLFIFADNIFWILTCIRCIILG